MSTTLLVACWAVIVLGFLTMVCSLVLFEEDEF